MPNFTQSGGGTWYDGVATMSRARVGNFAALIPASIAAAQTTPSSTILMAGGSSSGGAAGKFAPEPTSDICFENTQSTVNGHFAVSCSADTASYDSTTTHLGFTPNTALGAEDASHLTIGCNPAEGYVGSSSPNTSTQCNGVARLAGETSDASYDGLILACGGLAGGANLTGGNDTQIDCEYYVPGGRNVPAGLSCNPSGATGGPAWCVKPGLLMNRERAHFALVEAPARCGSTADSFWSLGGVYGSPDATSLNHLTRKNVEWLAKDGVSACTTPLAGGANHSLVVMTNGAIWATGTNDFGQLGDGTTSTNAGEQIPSLSGVKAVAAGRYHSLAVTTSNAVLAWGLNNYGQLGDGTTTNRLRPAQVTRLTRGVVAVAAGLGHSLGLLSDGRVAAWGANYSGQLGDGATTASSTPVQVTNLPASNAIAAGRDHSLALDATGTVWAWGDNSHGQLGDGSTSNRSTPVAVVSGAIAISAGTYHSLAVKADGTVWAWGSNTYGQLGNGTTADSTTPVEVCAAGAAAPCSSFLSGAAAVASGWGHSIVLRRDGTVWDWGYNGDDELGIGSMVNQSTPVQAQFTTTAPASGVSAGDFQSMAVTADGTFWQWGLHPDPHLCTAPTPQTTTDPTAKVAAIAIAATAAGLAIGTATSEEPSPAISDAYDFSYPDGLNTTGEASSQAATVTNPGKMQGFSASNARAADAFSNLPRDTYFFFTGHGGPVQNTSAWSALWFWNGAHDSYMAATLPGCSIIGRQAQLTSTPPTCYVPQWPQRPHSLVVLSACLSAEPDISGLSLARSVRETRSIGSEPRNLAPQTGERRRGVVAVPPIVLTVVETHGVDARDGQSLWQSCGGAYSGEFDHPDRSTAPHSSASSCCAPVPRWAAVCCIPNRGAGRHVHPHARPDAAPPPVPTGIDYLALIAQRRAAELAGEPIDYAALSSQSDTDTNTDPDAENEETDENEEEISSCEAQSTPPNRLVACSIVASLACAR